MVSDQSFHGRVLKGLLYDTLRQTDEGPGGRRSENGDRRWRSDLRPPSSNNLRCARNHVNANTAESGERRTDLRPPNPDPPLALAAVAGADCLRPDAPPIRRRGFRSAARQPPGGGRLETLSTTFCQRARVDYHRASAGGGANRKCGTCHRGASAPTNE